MIDSASIFESVRRGYTDLQGASPSEIQDYFASMDPETLTGHISNVKGIVFETEVVNALNDQGVDCAMFETTNHPVSDIAIFDDGDIIAELQLKATDNFDYIAATLDSNPDVPIIATHEVASQFVDNNMVIDSGLSNEVLTEAVTQTLSDEAASEAVREVTKEVAHDAVSDTLADAVTDVAVPFGPIGLLKLGIGLLTGLF